MSTTATRPSSDAAQAALRPEEIGGRKYITKKVSFWEKNKRYWIPMLTLVIVLTVWEIAGMLGAWDPLFFASPTQIAAGMLELARGPLWSDLAVSGTEFVIGLGLSLAIGIPVGMLLGSIRWLYLAFDPFINAIYSTPILVLTPLLVIWFGLGMGSKIANVVILATLPFVITTIEGLRATDASLLRAARSYGAKGFTLYRKIYFPAMLPFFITGLRLAIGKGMIAVVVGEYIAASAGVGFRIRSDAEYFRTGQYLAGVVIMVIISVIVMALVKMLERKLAPWRHVTMLDD